jgi:ribosome biogenesis GTPase A
MLPDFALTRKAIYLGISCVNFIHLLRGAVGKIQLLAFWQKSNLQRPAILVHCSNQLSYRVQEEKKLSIFSVIQGGEADINTVAKMVLNDFQRGKLPYFVSPPSQVSL